MAVPKYTITTRMEKEDYRKFLYIATFLRKKSVIPMIAGMCLLAAFFVTLNSATLSLAGFIPVFLFFFALSIAIICFKVERKNNQRIKTDKTGSFGSESVLQFCDDHLIMDNKSLHSHSELYYNQFYGVSESKDYFIFYITVNQASLLRKKDMEVAQIEEFRQFLQSVFRDRYKKN